MILQKKLRLSLLLIPFLFALVLMWTSHAYAADYDDIADGNWNSDATWSGTGIPGINDNVTIDSNTVTLTATQSVNDITISAGGTYTAGANTLNVGGDWNSIGGTFNYGTGKIIMTGTSKAFNSSQFPARSWNLTIGDGVNPASVTVSGGNWMYVAEQDLVLADNASLTVTGTFDYLPATGNLTLGTGATLNITNNLTRYINDSSSHISGPGAFGGAGTFQYHATAGSFNAPVTARTYGVDVAISGALNDVGLLGGGASLDLGTKTLYLFDINTNNGAYGILDNTGNIPVTAAELQVASTSGSANLPTKTGKLICRGAVYTFTDVTVNSSTTAAPTIDCLTGGESSTWNVSGNVTIDDSRTFDGIVTAGSSTWAVGGNWTEDANATFTAGTSTVAFNGTAAQGITSGGDSLYNLTISNTSDTVSLSDDLALLAGGTLTINANATLDLNGNNLTVPTTFNNNGTLQLKGGETVPAPVNGSGSLVKYDGTAGPYNLNNWTYDSLELASSSAATYDLTADLTLPGNLTIGSNNTLDTNNNDLNVAGDWTNNGTFIAGTGMVTLNGTGTQDVWSGGSAFNTLEITNSTSAVTFLDDLTAVNFTSNTPSAAMRFNAGSTYTVTNLTLNGAEGSRITLRSTSPGTWWFLNVSGTQSLSYVDVADSNASGGDTIICAIGCVDIRANNVKWEGLIVSIPTMNEWGMIIFMLLAGFVAVYYLPTGRQA